MARQRRLNARWRRIGQKIDQYSRFLFPSVYVLAMLILFHLDLSDRYAGRNAGGEFESMKPYLHSMDMQISSVSLIWVFVGVFVTMLASIEALLQCVLLPARRRRGIEFLRSGASTAMAKKQRDQKLNEKLSDRQSTVGLQSTASTKPLKPSMSSRKNVVVPAAQ